MECGQLRSQMHLKFPIWPSNHIPQCVYGHNTFETNFSTMTKPRSHTLQHSHTSTVINETLHMLFTLQVQSHNASISYSSTFILLRSPGQNIDGRCVVTELLDELIPLLLRTAIVSVEVVLCPRVGLGGAWLNVRHANSQLLSERRWYVMVLIPNHRTHKKN